MTLIQAIRSARKNERKWLAIDESQRVYGYFRKPEKANFGKCNEWEDSGGYLLLGYCYLNCNWRDTLIELDKIKVQ